jgi:hypothetical protein
MSIKNDIEKAIGKILSEFLIFGLCTFFLCFLPLTINESMNLESAYNFCVFDTPTNIVEKMFIFVLLALVANFECIC